jgi:spore coat-associated protein N
VDLKAWKLRRPGRWTVTAGVALISLGLLSFNAFASFTASTSVTQDVSSGTMTLTLGATGSVTNRMNIAASDIVPGDTIQRTLTITTGGTLSMSDIQLTLTAPSSSLLDTNATHGLQILIEKCSQQWTESGPPYTYSCGGSTGTLLASQSVTALKSAGATSLSGENVSGATYMRITLTFPGTADDSYQGQTTQLQYAWSGVQPTAGDK